jgi:ketosteroid isomerase-like protein
MTALFERLGLISGACFVVAACLAPATALALPDDAALTQLLLGTWQGPRHETQYRADGTWVLDPPDDGENKRGKWRIEHGRLIETWRLTDETEDSSSVEEIIELTEKIFKSRIILQEGPGKPEGQVLPSEIFTVTRVTEKNLEKAVRDADAEWSKVAAAKDLDKTVAFYADDAVIFPPNQPAVTNKDGIRNLWKRFLDSFTDISWKTTRVEVAKSGDMAILTGTYEMTMTDGSKDNGKYCEVWQNKADGKWKVGIDMFSSDLPAQPVSPPGPGAAEKK